MSRDIDEIKKIEIDAAEASPIPTLDEATANRILEAALEAGKIDPSSIPAEMLEKRGKPSRPAFGKAKKFTYALIIVTLLLPMMFITPSISAKRINISETLQSSAMYSIDIHGILPVRNVSATLDGEPLSVSKNSGKNYVATLDNNGELVITAVSINGQIRSRNYTVEFLDTERPVFIGSKYSESSIEITVEDTFSGINYNGIEGLKVISVDEEEGTITFQKPNKATAVKVPDNAGNILKMIVKP